MALTLPEYAYFWVHVFRFTPLSSALALPRYIDKSGCRRNRTAGLFRGPEEEAEAGGDWFKVSADEERGEMEGREGETGFG